MIGESIKGYRIVGRLGKGGMGEVWLAQQPIVETRVAIKVLLPELSGDQQLVQRFFNEARAVNRIKHAGIVKIHDVGFLDGGAAFLIMELLEGETLATRIRRIGRLALPQVAELGRQIASIVAATHAAGITHRDLKPDNIFIVQDAELASGERVKVLDFGIAKLGSVAGITGTGLTMGTPSYMAPEQWVDSARADQRSDVYALGCIAFEMCCGRPPFVVATLAEGYTKHTYELPPRARSLVPAVPAALDELIAAALAKPPEARPPIDEVQRVFARLIQPVADAPPPGPVPPTLPPSLPVAPVPVPPTLPIGSSPPVAPVHAVRSAGGGHAPWSLVAAGIAALVIGAALVVIVQHHLSNDPAPGDPSGGSGGPSSGLSADDLARLGGHPTVSKQVRDMVLAPLSAAGHGRCPSGMVHVPPGTFSMGSPDDAPGAKAGGKDGANGSAGDSDERPVHTVTLSSGYCFDQAEVTAGAYHSCVASGACTAAREPSGSGVDGLCNGSRVDRANHPINCVDWAQAQAYCAAQHKRLPSEAEWEHAARGSDGRLYPWGDGAPTAKRLNACDDSCRALGERLGVGWTALYDDSDGWAATAPVGSSPDDTSPFGASDLGGNVAEWTADWYGPYAAGPATDPHGPAEGSGRVVRGGSWDSDSAARLRTTRRAWYGPAIQLANLGFRCVVSD